MGNKVSHRTNNEINVQLLKATKKSSFSRNTNNILKTGSNKEEENENSDMNKDYRITEDIDGKNNGEEGKTIFATSSTHVNKVDESVVVKTSPLVNRAEEISVQTSQILYSLTNESEKYIFSFTELVIKDVYEKLFELIKNKVFKPHNTEVILFQIEDNRMSGRAANHKTDNEANEEATIAGLDNTNNDGQLKNEVDTTNVRNGKNIIKTFEDLVKTDLVGISSSMEHKQKPVSNKITSNQNPSVIAVTVTLNENDEIEDPPEASAGDAQENNNASIDKLSNTLTSVNAKHKRNGFPKKVSFDDETVVYTIERSDEYHSQFLYEFSANLAEDIFKNVKSKLIYHKKM